MNSLQYRRAIENRHPYDVRPLFASEEVAGYLRRAAGHVRGMDYAVEAWSKVAPPEVADLTNVDTFKDGILRVGVLDSATCHYLHHQKAALRRYLAGVLPGVRELCFVVRGESWSSGRDGG